MTKKKTAVNKSTDILFWFIIALLTVGALFANYHYSSVVLSLRIIGWIFWLLITLGLAALTSSGKLAIEYLKESKNEIRKVVWPNRKETVQTTVIVMVMVTITGLVLWGIDSGLMWMIGKITHISG
jgi:preprotein translocase subunit SecE